MCLEFPELSKDRAFKTNLGLDFYRESEFEELVQLSNYKKRADFVTGLAEYKMKIGEEEVPYFDKDFLVQRFMQLSPDQFKQNSDYKKKEAAEAEKASKGKEEGEEG